MLDKLFRWCGNPVISNMRDKDLLPKRYKNIQIDSLTEHEIENIRKCAHKIKGWITRSDVMRCYWTAKSKKIHREYEEALFDRYEGEFE